MKKKKISNAESNELKIYADSLEKVIKQNNLPKWEDLDNDQRKSILVDIKNESDEALKDKDRLYKLGFTYDKADKVQLMAEKNFEVSKAE